MVSNTCEKLCQCLKKKNKLSMVIIKCCFQWYMRFTAQLYKWTRKEEFFIAYFSAPYAWHFLNIESSRRNNKRWCTRIRTIVTRFSTSIFIDLGAKVPHKKMRSKNKTLLYTIYILVCYGRSKMILNLCSYRYLDWYHNTIF